MKNLILILLTFATITAFGQDKDSKEIQRKGFVIGVGVGGGVISISDKGQENPFDEANGGISLPNLKIGFMV